MLLIPLEKPEKLKMPMFLERCPAGFPSPASDFTPTGVTQLSLFDEGKTYANSDTLMNVLDTINNSGKGKVWFAGRGNAPAWAMRRDMLSPAYTTRWNEIPAAKL